MAASDAVLVGAALPRDTVRAAFSESATVIFDGDAALFGLDLPLPAGELKARKQLQFEAHCEAMPMEMMAGMVEAQRLRDAAFAQATIAALEKFGAPVVLITGNGHARRDWGVPAYLARVAPDASVLSVGQGENGGDPGGIFDAVWDAPATDRPDPCTAFQ